MRRRTTFLAVALAALPSLALAQAPADAPKPKLFDFYGTLDANSHYTKASGSTTATQDVKGRAAVSIDSSNIGIRGTLVANEYAGATYQCETGASIDGIGGAVLCNRNSRVGITGNWGTLWWGNWDTPFKGAAYGTKADDPFNKTDVFGYQGIMGSPGFNYRSGSYSTASNSTTVGFDIRAQNSIGYHSPKVEGVSVKLQYSVNEFANANVTQDPSLWGAVLNWDSGPFSVFAAYESHRDGFALVSINGAAGANFQSTAANNAGNATTSNHTSDTAWRVGAGYQLDSPAGATTLSGMYDQLSLKQDGAGAGAVQEYKRGAWQVALKHRYGDHEIRARYSSAANGSVTLVGGGGSTTDYGASMLALGYAYWVLPTFNVYLHFAQISNKDQAQYTLTIGGSPSVVGPNTPRGADPMAVGLGCRYTF